MSAIDEALDYLENNPTADEAQDARRRARAEVAALRCKTWEQAADAVAMRKRTLEAIGIHPAAASVLDEVVILLRARAERNGESSSTPVD